MRIRVLLVAWVVAISGCGSGPAQPTCTYTLSATAMTMGPAGGAGSITISTGSSCAWTGRSDASWITATGGTSVTGPGTFSFTVAAAPDASARTGMLTVANQTVSVSQQGVACTYSLSPSSMSFGAAGGSTSFSVTTSSGCSWTATTSAPWLSVTSGASSAGSGTVTYSVAANSDAAPRTGTLSVAGQTHTVMQADRSTCSVTINPDDETFGVAGGSGTFDVAAASSCSWTVIANALWISITDPAGGFGTGNRRISYSVVANAAVAARTGTMTVGGQTFVVTQAGTTACEYSVAPTDVNACMSEGFARSVTVTTSTGCPWTSSSAASWLTVASGLSGIGTGTITYSLGANFDAARQGIIAVRWPTPTAGQNVRVNQAGCNYGIGWQSGPAPAAGGDFSFMVFSSSTDVSCEGPMGGGCWWSAVSSASWVTVLSSMPRVGDYYVLFRVAANTTGHLRSATITVHDKTIVIEQVGS